MKTTEVDYEEGYHAKRHSSHFNNDYYEARAKVALRKFFPDINGTEKILDFGCGMGQNILYLDNAQGYDISEYALDFAKSKGLKVTDDLEGLPDNSFDIVFTAHVLEHHPNPKEMVQNMKSKLKPNGRLVLVIPHEKHGKSSFELDLNQHLFSWTFRTINNLLMTNGFKISNNKYLRGAGYEKLLPIYRKSFGLYYLLTNVVSRLFGIKEIMVTAVKIEE